MSGESFRGGPYSPDSPDFESVVRQTDKLDDKSKESHDEGSQKGESSSKETEIRVPNTLTNQEKNELLYYYLVFGSILKKHDNDSITPYLNESLGDFLKRIQDDKKTANLFAKFQPEIFSNQLLPNQLEDYKKDIEDFHRKYPKIASELGASLTEPDSQPKDDPTEEKTTLTEKKLEQEILELSSVREKSLHLSVNANSADFINRNKLDFLKPLNSDELISILSEQSKIVKETIIKYYNNIINTPGFNSNEAGSDKSLRLKVNSLFNDLVSDYFDYRAIIMSLEADNLSSDDEQLKNQKELLSKRSRELSTLSMIIYNNNHEQQSKGENEFGIDIKVQDNASYLIKASNFLSELQTQDGQMILDSAVDFAADDASLLLEVLKNQINEVQTSIIGDNKRIDGKLKKLGAVNPLVKRAFEEKWDLSSFLSLVAFNTDADVSQHLKMEKIWGNQQYVVDIKKNLLLGNNEKAGNYLALQQQFDRRVGEVAALKDDDLLSKKFCDLSYGCLRGKESNEFIKKIQADAGVEADNYSFSQEFGDTQFFDYQTLDYKDKNGVNHSKELGKIVKRVYELSTDVSGKQINLLDENWASSKQLEKNINRAFEEAIAQEKKALENNPKLKVNDSYVNSAGETCVFTGISMESEAVLATYKFMVSYKFARDDLGYQGALFLHGTQNRALPPAEVFQRDDDTGIVAEMIYRIKQGNVAGYYLLSLVWDLEDLLSESKLRLNKGPNIKMQNEVLRNIDRLKRYWDARYQNGTVSEWRTRFDIGNSDPYSPSMDSSRQAFRGKTKLGFTREAYFKYIKSSYEDAIYDSWTEEKKRQAIDREMAFFDNEHPELKNVDKVEETAASNYPVKIKSMLPFPPKSFITNQPPAAMQYDKDAYTAVDNYLGALDAFRQIINLAITPVNSVQVVARIGSINSQFSRLITVTNRFTEVEDMCIAALSFFFEQVLHNVSGVNEVKYSILKSKYMPTDMGRRYNIEYDRALENIYKALNGSSGGEKMKPNFLNKIYPILDYLKTKCKKAEVIVDKISLNYKADDNAYTQAAIKYNEESIKNDAVALGFPFTIEYERIDDKFGNKTSAPKYVKYLDKRVGEIDPVTRGVKWTDKPADLNNYMRILPGLIDQKPGDPRSSPQEAVEPK